MHPRLIGKSGNGGKIPGFDFFQAVFLESRRAKGVLSLDITRKEKGRK